MSNTTQPVCDRVQALIQRHWPTLLEVYISPLSTGEEIKKWQVELKLKAQHFLPTGHSGDSIAFHGLSVEDALGQAEAWID